VSVELSEKERSIYDHVFNKAKDAFRENVAAGTVLKSYTAIFAQILRLRQTCCHPVLVRHRELVADEEDRHAAADAASGLADDMDLETLIQSFAAEAAAAERETTFEAHVLQQIRDEATNECPICAEEPMVEQTVASGCWHSTCKRCIMDYIKYETDRARTPTCVQCRRPIGFRDLFEVIRYDEGSDEGEASSLVPSTASAPPPRIALERIGVRDSSAKISALVSHLRALRREHPRMKSVVFSQFTSFLDIIEPALDRARVAYLRLDGTMAQRARAAVLDEFRDPSRGFCVLLISLRAGGVGLNLTSAGRVFMMDPWWSFAVEAQAIDRVHRMGQTEEVKVVRFIVKDSVEERMLRVQDRKKFM
jgi:DNA repair protein RAD5